jgi:prepilin-type processing-associated H-X9-DG protein
MGDEAAGTQTRARRRSSGCLAISLAAPLAVGLLIYWRLAATTPQFVCASQLHTLGYAFRLYCHDYDDKLPVEVSALGAVIDYQTQIDMGWCQRGPEFLLCPGDPNQRHLGAITNWQLDADGSGRCSYDCALAYGPARDNPDGGDPLMWDIDGGDPKSPRANHRHLRGSWGNVLYFDGHEQRVPSSQWPSANRPPVRDHPGRPMNEASQNARQDAPPSDARPPGRP